jgi:hypothetical protein
LFEPLDKLDSLFYEIDEKNENIERLLGKYLKSFNND